MSFRLSNRVAIITGSTSGLDPAIALAYAAEGASIMCADLKPNAPAKGMEEFPMATHEAISKSGGKAIFVKTDIREEEEIKSLVAETVEEFERLDIIISKAGIAIGDINSLASQPGSRRVHEVETSMFDLTMSINTRGVFLGCKYALAQFLSQEPLPENSRGDRTRGWIVNVASKGGLVALAGAPSNTISKHAVARAAVFLVSEDAQWITGHPLVVAGRYAAR